MLANRYHFLWHLSDRVFVCMSACLSAQEVNKKLICRKDTVRLPRESILVKCNWETLFYGHYRSSTTVT